MFWLGPLGVTVMQMENNNASVRSEHGGRVIEMLSPAARSPLPDLFMRLPRHGVTAKKGKVLGNPPRTSGNLLLGKRGRVGSCCVLGAGFHTCLAANHVPGALNCQVPWWPRPQYPFGIPGCWLRASSRPLPFPQPLQRGSGCFSPEPSARGVLLAQKDLLAPCSSRVLGSCSMVCRAGFPTSLMEGERGFQVDPGSI